MGDFFSVYVWYDTVFLKVDSDSDSLGDIDIHIDIDFTL